MSSKLCSYFPEPRTEVYCFRLNLNISKLMLIMSRVIKNMYFFVFDPQKMIIKVEKWKKLILTLGINMLAKDTWRHGCTKALQHTTQHYIQNKVNMELLTKLLMLNTILISVESPILVVTIYLTNRFHVAVRLFSNRSQMTSKCGKNKKVAHEAIAECVTDDLTTFWHCDLLLNRHTVTWNLFVLYNKETKQLFPTSSLRLSSNGS